MKLNKSLLILSGLVILFLSKSFSQNIRNSNQVRFDSLKIQANRLAQAILTVDTATIVRYSHRVIIDSFFYGEKNVGNSIREGQKDAEAMGFKNLSRAIGETSKIAVAGKKMYAFIQTSSMGLIKQDTVKSESFYLGISDDEGLNWQFVEESFIFVSGIKKFFPDYDGQIPIPARKEPIFTQKR